MTDDEGEGFDEVAWRISYSERRALGGTPTAFIVVTDELAPVGAGATLAEALESARRWESEEATACPHCGRMPAEAKWHVYPFDSETLSFLTSHCHFYDPPRASLWLERDMITDGTIRWYPERGCYRWTLEAECIACHADNDDGCEMCDDRGYLEPEGFEPDAELPPAEYEIKGWA